MRVSLLATLLLFVLVGCAPAREQAQAVAATTGFVTAVAHSDGPGACRLLIDAARKSLESDSGQPCAKAVLDLHESAGAVRARVWGDEAQVDIPGDTLFLDHTHAGWRVRAAGCVAQGEHQPYDCEVAP